MKVLAIGATGFIGAHVVRGLVERGHEVAIVHRGEATVQFPGEVQRIRGDRNVLADLQSELAGFGPDVVLDVIAYTEKQATELVRVFRGLAGRLVVLSSADVYRNYDGVRGKSTAPPDPVPLTEDSPLRDAFYPYRGQDMTFEYRDDYEKILVERAVMSHSYLPGTVLRLPAVYGPGDKQRRLAPYVRRMTDGRPAILLDAHQARWRWTRGYVENVAAAIALAVTDARAAGRTYNVGDLHALTEQQWVERIGSAVGWQGEVVTPSDEQLPAPLRQPLDWRYELAVDTRRIRDELGYQDPVPESQAIHETVQWERAQVGGESPDYAAEDASLAQMRRDAS